MRATLDVRSEDEEGETFVTDEGTLDTPANVISDSAGFLDSKLDLKLSSLADVSGKRSETFSRCETCLVALNIQNTTTAA